MKTDKENKISNTHFTHPPINAVVRALVAAPKPEKKFNLKKQITVTMAELVLFVQTVRNDETGWASWVAVEAAKEYGTRTANSISMERARRHAALARGMKKTLRPELAQFIHGNPQIKD